MLTGAGMSKRDKTRSTWNSLAPKADTSRECAACKDRMDDLSRAVDRMEDRLPTLVTKWVFAVLGALVALMVATIAAIEYASR